MFIKQITIDGVEGDVEILHIDGSALVTSGNRVVCEIRKNDERGDIANKAMEAVMIICGRRGSRFVGFKPNATNSMIEDVLNEIERVAGCWAPTRTNPRSNAMSDAKTTDDRLRSHPMYSPSDLRFLRRKGYSDETILAFWDRDHAAGQGPVRHKVTLTFEGIELLSGGEALQHANADPRLDTAILLGGKHYAVTKATAERLEVEGIGFAYLCDHQMPDGTWRIVTVPVNPRND